MVTAKGVVSGIYIYFQLLRHFYQIFLFRSMNVWSVPNFVNSDFFSINLGKI